MDLRPGLSSLTWDDDALGLPDARAVRVGVPVVAAAVGALAQVSDPGPVSGVVAVAVAVAVFALWAWSGRVPPVALVVGVAGPVVVAGRDGRLEPALFLVAVSAIVVAWFEPSQARAVAAGTIATASPVVVRLLVPADEGFSWWIWVLGIAFPWLIGRLVRRQLDLVARLDAARAELAARVVTEERQLIARDVHDLVGHGLAAVLLQIAGARHVLRRDPDAADEALVAAESAGRASMGELRRTMILLRGDAGIPPVAPAGLDGLDSLVGDAAEHGLQVRYESTGDTARVGGGVALAVHRIVAESLANARHHAPRASTGVAVAVGASEVTLRVTSCGPLSPVRDGDRPRFGLVGMGERARAVGGELWAGPTSDGWAVRARLPLGGVP